MIFLFHQSFTLRKRTVWIFVNRFSEEILIKFISIIIIIIIIIISTIIMMMMMMMMMMMPGFIKTRSPIYLVAYGMNYLHILKHQVSLVTSLVTWRLLTLAN